MTFFVFIVVFISSGFCYSQRKTAFSRAQAMLAFHRRKQRTKTIQKKYVYFFLMTLYWSNIFFARGAVAVLHISRRNVWLSIHFWSESVTATIVFHQSWLFVQIMKDLLSAVATVAERNSAVVLLFSLFSFLGVSLSFLNGNDTCCIGIWGGRGAIPIPSGGVRRMLLPDENRFCHQNYSQVTTWKHGL